MKVQSWNILSPKLHIIVPGKLKFEGIPMFETEVKV